MSILNSLPHRCDGYLRTRTRDELGGSVDTYTLVFQDRPCWQQTASDSEVMEYDKRGIAVTNKVYFTVNPGLNDKHQLEIDGIRFDVQSRAVPDASAGMGVVWRVMLRATTNEGEAI